MACDDIIRYGDLCRLCAAKTNVILGINIFENEGTIRQVDKKIEICLPVQIHEADELPKMICQTCLYKLEQFFDFRERSVRTETLLVELFKEINAARLQNEQQLVKISQQMDVSLDHPDLIMVQQHQQLLNEHNLQSVEEMELSHLGQRENMMADQEIILTQQTVDIPHSLDNIDLNNSELASQDLPNRSLNTQETILIDNVQNNKFSEENLELVNDEHHLLTGRYNLQQSVHVNMSENSNDINEISVSLSTHSLLQQPLNNVLSKLKNDEDIPKEIVHEEISEEKDRDTELKHKIEEDSVIDNLTKKHINSDHLEHRKNNANTLLVDDQLQDYKSDNLYVNEDIQSENSNNSTCLSINANSSNDWLYCNMCGKTFDQEIELQLHYEQHFNKCSCCLAVFTNREALNAHRRQLHSSSNDHKQIKTRLKRATLPIRLDIKELKEESNSDDGVNDTEHAEDEEDEDDPGIDLSESGIGKRKKWFPKICQECGKAYKTNYKLTEHMRKHTGEKPYKCNSCEKAFRSKIGLAQHEAKHTGQYDFACPTCGKGFQCKSYLMVHQRVHSDIKPYPCTTCGRNFKTKQSLLDHTNRHLGVKPYMCDICGRGFITNGLCRAHQKVHSGLDNRKFSCKVCNKMFVSKSYLQTHLRIHTGEKPFMCEVCGKGFLTRVDLRIHSTMHTGEKSYVCEMCGKAFARRDALRCHRRSHTGERPYSCDQCGQTFTQFSPMAIHKRLHTGERPYSCEVCGKAFVSRSTMMSHWKKHVR